MELNMELDQVSEATCLKLNLFFLVTVYVKRSILHVRISRLGRGRIASIIDLYFGRIVEMLASQHQGETELGEAIMASENINWM